ncbi:MAG TPA: hypothetical protein DDW52_16930 [Planctomycetaceae bacterium]|nr:hypothetical protein [Planctomycetaceae bacterium]
MLANLSLPCAAPKRKLLLAAAALLKVDHRPRFAARDCSDLYRPANKHTFAPKLFNTHQHTAIVALFQSGKLDEGNKSLQLRFTENGNTKSTASWG